jgi:hypothetical protein
MGLFSDRTLNQLHAWSDSLTARCDIPWAPMLKKPKRLMSPEKVDLLTDRSPHTKWIRVPFPRLSPHTALLSSPPPSCLHQRHCRAPPLAAAIAVPLPLPPPLLRCHCRAAAIAAAITGGRQLRYAERRRSRCLRAYRRICHAGLQMPCNAPER